LREKRRRTKANFDEEMGRSKKMRRRIEKRNGREAQEEVARGKSKRKKLSREAHGTFRNGIETAHSQVEDKEDENCPRKRKKNGDVSGGEKKRIRSRICNKSQVRIRGTNPTPRGALSKENERKIRRQDGREKAGSGQSLLQN